MGTVQGLQQRAGERSFLKIQTPLTQLLTDRASLDKEVAAECEGVSPASPETKQKLGFCLERTRRGTRRKERGINKKSGLLVSRRSLPRHCTHLQF